MKKYHLVCTSFTRRSRRYRSYKGQVGRTAKNRVNRRFFSCIPNQKIYTDISEFHYNERNSEGITVKRKAYLSPFLDGFLEINEISFTKFNSLNKLFKDRSLNSYLEYPLSWIDNKNGVAEFRSMSVQLFLSIISNRIINKNKYLIRGYKTVYLDIQSDFLFSDDIALIIGKLISFIIDEQRSKDKLLILRNTMTLFLNSEETANELEVSLKEIENNVEYNFNAYIQDKIKLFFEDKNKLYLEYINTTRKIEDQINSMIAQFRTIALSLLGTIFLSLLNSVGGAKTVPLINLVLSSYLIYFVLNLFLMWKQDVQIEAILNSLKQYTNSIKINDEEMSYEKLKKDYLQESIDSFYMYRKKFISLLIILIVIFVLLFISNRIDAFTFPKQIFKFIIGY